AVGRNDANPLPWLEATLERARVYGPAHLLLARWLVPRSPSQARLEFRLAMEQAPELIPEAMADAPRVVRSFSDAERLLPNGPRKAELQELLVRSVGQRLP